MTEASDQANARARLAYIVHVLRRDWDMTGIEKAIEEAAKAHPLGDLCRAAIDAALTLSTKTPAGIGARLRDGWTSNQSQERLPQIFSGPQAVMCDVPGHKFHAGDPCDGKPIRPRSDTAERAVASAREALAEAVKAQREEAAEAVRAEREAWREVFSGPQAEAQPEESAA